MHATNQFSGLFTALITPMHPDGSLELESFRRLVQDQVAAGVQGVLVLGTTAESSSLTTEEEKTLIQIALEEASGRCSVMVGTGTNNTPKAIEKTRMADQLGADGILLVTPYYNKPNPAGLLDYYTQIAKTTEKPIILYSNPSRCGIEIPISVTEILSKKFPHICALKETGAVNRVAEVRSALGDRIDVLCGDDINLLPYASLGAHGLISVVSNLIPGPMVEIMKLISQNDFSNARTAFEQQYDIIKNIFSVDTNPVGIKEALYHFGKISNPAMRSPMHPLSENERRIFRQQLEQSTPAFVCA